MNYIKKNELLSAVEADIAEGKLSHCVGNTLIRYIMQCGGCSDVNVLNQAVVTFGEGHQIRKLVEEMAELLAAIFKHLDDRDTVDHIAEEIADVFIMLQQMSIIFGCGDAVSNWYQAKLERLAGNVEQKQRTDAKTIVEIFAELLKCPR